MAQDPEGIAELASGQFLKLLFSAAPHTTTPQISLLLKKTVTDILQRSRSNLTVQEGRGS